MSEKKLFSFLVVIICFGLMALMIIGVVIKEAITGDLFGHKTEIVEETPENPNQETGAIIIDGKKFIS